VWLSSDARRVVSRIWHGALAVIIVLALALQWWIAARVPGAPHGTDTGKLSGGSLIERLIRVLSFFTIQSNVLSMLTAATLARNASRDGPVWRVLRMDALLGITVTGIVYSTVLAAIHEPNGWQETLTNDVFHYIAPIGTVLGWLLFGPRPRTSTSVVCWSLLWPLSWFAYTLFRGGIWSWYPYPFVAVLSHGYARVLSNGVLVLLVFAALAGLCLIADRMLPPTPIAMPDDGRINRLT
jgi:hypothetical protein